MCKQVTNSHKDRCSGILGDYCDSEEFCKHPLFSKDGKALQIVLYYDELELCNPLGSRRKKHKIGMNIHNHAYCAVYHFFEILITRCILLHPWEYASSI